MVGMKLGMMVGMINDTSWNPMTENQIKRLKFVPLLQKKFKRAFIYCPHDTLTAGIPDVIMLHKKKLHAFELKMRGETLLHQQVIVLKAIMQAGGLSYIVYLSENPFNITDDRKAMQSICIKDYRFAMEEFGGIFAKIFMLGKDNKAFIDII